MTFFPRWCVSTHGSVNSGFCSRLVLSTWDSVHLGVCLLGFCPLGSLATWHYAPSRIVSTIDSVNSGFCQRMDLSTWESVHPGGCLLGISSFGNLATWHSAHVGLCLLLVQSTLDCAHFWFCLPRSPSTWDFIYSDSVLSEDCPHDELLPKDCAHSWFCPIWILLTFASVYLGVSPHDILPMQDCVPYSFCQLQILLTICSIFLEVCLTGCLSTVILSILGV